MTAANYFVLFVIVFIIIFLLIVVWNITHHKKPSVNEEIQSVLPYVWKCFISYQENEPYFESFFRFSKKITVDIKGILTFTLALQNEDHVGWKIFIEDFKITTESSRNVIYDAFSKLTQNINTVLHQQRMIEFSEVLEMDDDWDYLISKSSGYSLNLVPSLENITPFPQKAQKNHICLSYQNGNPIFIQNNQLGRMIHLNFGICTHNNNPFPIIVFQIGLLNDKKGWYLSDLNAPIINDKFKNYQIPWNSNQVNFMMGYDVTLGQYFFSQQKIIHEMINECNHALNNSLAIDLIKYEETWKLFDKYFQMKVIPNSLFVNYEFENL